MDDSNIKQIVSGLYELEGMAISAIQACMEDMVERPISPIVKIELVLRGNAMQRAIGREFNRQQRQLAGEP